MTTMVEMVARALAIYHGITDPDVPQPTGVHVLTDANGLPSIYRQHGPLWKVWEGDARAAIAAMREPTNSMWFVGDEKFNHLADEPHPHEVSGCVPVWQAMLDAALAEKEGK